MTQALDPKRLQDVANEAVQRRSRALDLVKALFADPEAVSLALEVFKEAGFVPSKPPAFAPREPFVPPPMFTPPTFGVPAVTLSDPRMLSSNISQEIAGILGRQPNKAMRTPDILAALRERGLEIGNLAMRVALSDPDLFEGGERGWWYLKGHAPRTDSKGAAP